MKIGFIENVGSTYKVEYIDVFTGHKISTKWPFMSLDEATQFILRDCGCFSKESYRAENQH